MATEYKLSYTASDIDTKLGKIAQIETNVQNIQNNYIQKDGNKGLSTNDFTNEDKAKLDSSVSQEYVDEQISKIEIPEGETVDLTNYYTKEEIDNKGFITSDDLPEIPEITIDEEISAASENPVQNKAIKAYIDGIALKGVELEVDKEVIDGSVNPVSGGAVYNALQNVEIDVDNKTIEPMTIDGAVVENFYNPDTADIVEGKYIGTDGRVSTNNGYKYFKVKLYSGRKYSINLANTYSVVVFDNDEISGTVLYSYSVGTTKMFEIPQLDKKIVVAYITCLNAPYNNIKGKVVVIEGETAPVGNEVYKVSYPWLSVPKEEKELVDPISIKGAEVENFYNPDEAYLVEGKYISYIDAYSIDGETYVYFKVKLFSGKSYRTNIGNIYSVVVTDNGKVANEGGIKLYGINVGSAMAFTIPEMSDKIVTAFISCTTTQYNKVKDKIAVVEGEAAPTGNEAYKISFPWLSTEDDEDEEAVQVLSAYSVDEVKLKQKMPPYLFDGIECNNYFDVEYMIANSTEDSRNKKYANTPYIYLPSGTYTINECYSYTLMSKDGEKGETVSAKTFTITEEYPYISFMILCQVGGVYDVNYLRKISVQKGESATANVPSTYKFNEKFNLKGSVKYYPTHWQGKKYVAIGDSITFGYNPKDESEGISSGGQMAYPYSRIVAENLNMERFNAGESGANVSCVLGLVDGYDNQVQQAIDFNADLVTVMIGVNDSSAAGTSRYVPLGTVDDVYDESNITFCSGLSEIVSRIQTALPNATIILLSSPKNNATLNQTKQNYFKAVKDVAEKYDVLFCDIHNGCGFNTNNPTVVRNFVLTDVHPNHRAHKVIGSRLTGFIASH